MKIPINRELKKIAYNYLSVIDCKDFMNLYKNMYFKIIFFFSY